MSGSSLDGIDAVLIEVDENSFNIIHREDIPFDEKLKIRLSESGSLNIMDYLSLQSDYSVFLGREINHRFTQSYDYMSVHGHTTHHFPTKLISNQMVDGGILSAMTEKKVVTDFRTGDVALGGTGTPMIPIAERNLFKGYDYYLNLGGIANITMAANWIAYDVCPCNQLLNYCAQQLGKEYDSNGDLARMGNLDNELYKQLGAFSYFDEAPPKAIDNNWIKNNYFSILKNKKNTQDTLHTISLWLSNVIVKQLASNGKLFITGGGAHNGFLIDCIRKEGKENGIEIIVPSKEIVDFKEAILMAYLGYLRISLKPTMLCSVTGAKMDSIGGAIYNVHGT